LALTFTEDDRGLLILQATGRLLRLNLDSGAVQVVELGERLWQGDVHRNGTVALVRADDHTVVEIHQGTRADRVAMSEASSVSKVRFSDNGEGLIAVTHSGDAIIWDMVEKRERHRAKHPDSPKKVPACDQSDHSQL
jgi:hypothetical protein